MGRLKVAPSKLATLSPTVAYLPQDTAERDRFRDTQHWRKWYRTTRWRRLRWATLLRDLFTCQRCGKLEGDTSKLVANHKRPHRGDERLFWDATNLETACKPCHDSVIQREERRGGM